MNKNILISGAIFGMLAIIIGAFATHGLKPLLTSDQIDSFETGVKYQMYNSLFLLILGGLPIVPERVKKTCCYLTVAGIILFSGSIYFLATNSLTSFDFTVIALVTPLGGSLLIAAWLVLLISLIKLKKK